MVKKKQKLTFSKKIVIAVIIVALIDIQFPFILAFLGKEEIAQTLAISIVTEIIGVVITYSVKAFFETREEEKVKLERDKMENDIVKVDIDGGAKG